MRVATTLALMTGLLAGSILTSHAFAADGATKGPNGETPTPAKTVTLTADEEQKIKDGKYTAALVWHEMSEYTNAVNAGAQDEFKRLGIEVVAQTDAGFDAARQKADVETVLASVRKTHRAVVAEEGWYFAGVGAQVVDEIQSQAFDELDAPVLF